MLAENPDGAAGAPIPVAPPRAPLAARVAAALRGSRSRAIAEVMLFLAVAAATYFPALGSGRLIYGTDTVGHDYIMHLYGWESILGRGEIPLWLPYLFFGLPMIGSFAFCPLYPTQALYLLLPHNTAFTMQYVLAVAAAGWCFSRLALVLGCRRWIALWAGLVFLFSGHFLTLTHAGHLQKMMAIAWAPLSLAAAIGLARAALRGEPRAMGRPALVLAAATAMQLLASHTQIAYGTLLLVGLVAGVAAVILLLRVWRAPGSGFGGLMRAPEFPQLGILVAAIAGALVLAGLLSAGQMMPGSEMAALSNRAGGVSFQEAVETSYPPAELLEYAVPSVYGDSRRNAPVAYFGEWGERIVSDFLGAPILLLAVAGTVAGRGRIRLLFAAAGILSLAAGLGRYTPFYSLLYDALPGWRNFRSPGTYMFIADMAIVALAALGMERWWAVAGTAQTDTGAKRVPLQALWIVCVAAGCALLVAGVARNSGFRFDIATPVEKQAWHTARGLAVLGMHLALAGAFFLLPASPACASGWRRRAAAAAPAVLALGVVVAGSLRFVQYEPLNRYREYLDFQPVYAALRQETATPLRMIEQNDLKNGHIRHAIASPTGYHPVLIGAYERYAGALGYASPAFGTAMYINYAHTYGSTPAPPGSWQPLREDANTRVWKWTGPARSYAAPSATIQTAADGEAVLGQITASPPQPATALITEAALKAAGLEAGPQEYSAGLEEWSPHRVRLKAGSRKPSLMPVAEVYYPGWRVAANDGQQLQVIPVNGALRGIVLPGGEHTITMEFAPFSWRLGLFLSWLTLAVMAIWTAGLAHGRVLDSAVGRRLSARIHTMLDSVGLGR